MGLLVVGFGLALYLYNSQRKRFLERQQLAQQQLSNQEEELLRASEQLQLFTRSISEKNQLIEELQERLGSQAPSEALLQLQQSILLTDEQWDNFRLLFEQVHHGFLGRLREKLPQLTPAEVRFLVLAKLQFSNKEMASMLGVSSQNIRTIWYRLRKKNNLPDDYPLSELIERI